VYIDATSQLLAPELAQQALDAKQAQPRPSTPKGTPGGSARPTSGGGKPQRPVTSGGRSPKRFHGTAVLDPDDLNGSMAALVQEVIEHFQSKLGTEVRVTVDIEARHGSGFDAQAVRTVRENSKSLKFTLAEFEDE